MGNFCVKMKERSSEQIEKDRLGPIQAGNVLQALVLGALERQTIILHAHCCQHMRAREFDSQDLYAALGTVDYNRRECKWNLKHRNWAYAVVGKDLDDKRLKIVFTVSECGEIVEIISGQRYSKGEPV